MWHYVEIDAEELRDAREIQKTQLARYLRVDIFKLEDMDIPWIRERIRYLDRVMQMESETTKVTEE
jgi:hypothetical protein